MRIGPDVAPAWNPPAANVAYADAAPSTKNAFRNTLARSFQHRRLWLNDPDCLMLRSADTALTEDQIATWARVVAASGGMAVISDDLALLGDDERRLLDDVIATGRYVDESAIPGHAPACPDLLDAWTPSRLRTPEGMLIVDPEAGRVTAG
jgi:alpha-galactosidase